MSLYESLSRVLAPFASRLNGLLTGYDGTTYSSPAEAVRTQISDLHVLIGDVPGAAIQASAVAYNDSNVAAELDGVNGRLGDLKSDLNQSSIDHSALIANEYIKHADGTIGGNASWMKRTDYMGVAPGSAIFLSLGSNPGTISDIIGLAFYDKNKRFVSGIDYTSLPIRANVPSTAYYIRFSIPVASLFDCYYDNTVDLSTVQSDLSTVQSDLSTVQSDLSTVQSDLSAESVYDQSGFISSAYIQHANGNVGTGYSYSTATDFISVVPSSNIFLSFGWNPQTLSDIIGLAFYDKEKRYISGVSYATHPVKAAVPQNAHYIRFSIPTRNLNTFLYKNVVDIPSLNNDISSLNNDIVAVKRIVSPVYINDSYINAYGTIISATNFRRTEPFKLCKGDTVRIEAKGYNYLAVLARYTGSAYEPLIVSDSKDQKVYTYSINDDGYYACSFQTAGYFDLSVIIYSSALSDRISALESEHAESPIMTNGKYVNINGSESAISWASVTDYLSVDGLKSFYTALRKNISVCYYDKNKVFISGFDAQTVPTEGTWYNAEPPQGAKYIRISTYSAIVPQVYVKYSIADTVVKYDKRLTALESGGERESNILSMYDTFIFIGDSLTWSQVYTSDTDQRRAYKTYPQVFASLCNGESYAFATPGDTALLWWQRSSAGAFDRHGLYVVFLGTNMELTDTIDTDCPGTDPDEFAQTQTGQYGRILQIISNNGDHAVLIKPFGGGGGNLPGTRAVIDAFAEKYNFATIDITSADRTTPAYHYWPNKEGSNGLHFNELGYAWLANEVFALINGLPAEDKFKIMRTQ
jgi:hypothetical protein